MKINITQLLSVFDELLPLSDEEQAIYWFKFSRKDDLYITLLVSVYENTANISVYNNPNANIAIASFHISNCLSIEVLDEQKKCIEILSGKNEGRCFVALLADTILEYDSDPKKSHLS
ncbi:MAG: hypothetical protein Q8K75_03805 [Chlamydiales bacterium]|nr:hypothetical protein [Chlamydiales bacterium]